MGIYHNGPGYPSAAAPLAEHLWRTKAPGVTESSELKGIEWPAKRKSGDSGSIPGCVPGGHAWGKFMSLTQPADPTLFHVRNHHSAARGTPPYIDDVNPNLYFGYFENDHAEQAIFIYDRDSRTATLYVGDAGWQTPHAVIDGAVPDLVLAATELLWLHACWQAATGIVGGVHG
jgi:hypothetical protein